MSDIIVKSTKTSDGYLCRASEDGGKSFSHPAGVFENENAAMNNMAFLVSHSFGTRALAPAAVKAFIIVFVVVMAIGAIMGFPSPSFLPANQGAMNWAAIGFLLSFALAMGFAQFRYGTKYNEVRKSIFFERANGERFGCVSA